MDEEEFKPVVKPPLRSALKSGTRPALLTVSFGPDTVFLLSPASSFVSEEEVYFSTSADSMAAPEEDKAGPESPPAASALVCASSDEVPGCETYDFSEMTSLLELDESAGYLSTATVCQSAMQNSQQPPVQAGPSN